MPQTYRSIKPENGDWEQDREISQSVEWSLTSLSTPMRILSSNELLEVWERGKHLSPIDKAIMLLAAACPECQPEELAGICIGQRDALLFAMRELSFGSELEAFCECPSCGTPLEWSMKTSDLLKGTRSCGDSELRLKSDGFEIDYRLPNSADLADIIGLGSEGGSQSLLTRCIVRAETQGREIAPDSLPGNVRSAVELRILANDPLSEIELDMECPSCANKWQMLLDIVSFFWAELDAHAKHLLRQVDILARNYGWSESDILSMSRQRRQHYIDMVTP